MNGWRLFKLVFCGALGLMAAFFVFSLILAILTPW